jgi:hypothetical protein
MRVELQREELLHVHRAAAAECSAVEFWVSSFRRFAPRAPIQQAGEVACRQITWADFESTVAARANGAIASPVADPDQFLAAMSMYEAWDSVAVVAECRHERIAVYWETLA